MMAFVRAEREADWSLHVVCVKAMIAYQFAAGHSNYARALIVYLRTIERLPPDILVHFLNGKHVMQHVEGLWNGIPSDNFIESTFMRYGHGRAGIVGVTLKPETLKTWALSRHVCSQLMVDLAEIRGDTDDDRFQTTHKEESPARMESDKKDREGVRKKIVMCIHPLDPDVHPKQLVNVANGSLAPSSVNVDKTITIAEEQVAAFEMTLPQGYIEFSTKCSARKARGSGGCKVFQLSSNSPLPPQNQVLSIPENKKQLIQITVETLVTEATVPGGHQSKLIVTGQDPTPIKISAGGITISRQDLRTTHEEADEIVVAQAIYAATRRGSMWVLLQMTQMSTLCCYITTTMDPSRAP
ncbi:hypothetical protein ACOMHN_012222 [Nucella lapillus]